MLKPRAILVAASLGLSGLVPLATLAPVSVAHAQSTRAPASPPSPAPSASAAGKDRAKRLFEEGAELEKKADYAGALAKYKEAEQITVTPGLRFHAGYCLEMTGKLAAALEEYEAADQLAREHNKPEVHAATAARLDPLRARVPQIAIRLATPVKDAEVQLDGVTVAAPLIEGGKGFRLDPGEHAVTARAAGHKPFSRKVQVPENVTTTVDVVMERVASSAPVVAPVVAPAGEPPVPNSPPGSATEPPTDAPSGRSRALPIATTAGAVVLAGAGLAMFLAAGSAQTTAQQDCATLVSCDDRRSRVRTFDALALGGFVGAVGLGVVSVIVWTSKAPERSSASPSARLLAGPSSLRLEGSF